MSQENVEIIKAMNATLNSGDLDGALTTFAPDAELRDLANGPDQPEVITGTDQLRQVWALWAEAFATSGSACSRCGTGIRRRRF